MNYLNSKFKIQNPKLLIGVLIIGFLLLPLLLDNYWTFTFGYIGIYVLMGLGLNIVVGYAGLLDLGYVAFYAIGAYTYAMLASTDYGTHFSFWSLLIISTLIVALVRLLLAIPVLRMRGDYLAIVTLGFGEIMQLLLRNLSPLTQGTYGIKGIHRPELFGYTLDQPIHFYYIILICCLLAVGITARLNNSRVGRAWVAIREDEDAAALCGINTTYYKVLAFIIGGAFAGAAGAVFAARQGYVSPDDFTLMVSINVLCVIIIGGLGSLPGVVLGAAVLIGMPEILRSAKELRLVIFGALLVAMMIFRPEGFLPSRIRRRELKGSAADGEED